MALVWHQHSNSLVAGRLQAAGTQLLHAQLAPIFHYTSLRIRAASSAGTQLGLSWGSLGQSGIFCPFLVVEEE